MNFYVLTLFPELIDNIVNSSITGRGITNGFMNVETVNIRDFATSKTNRVDDYPYGGGAGMVMEAEPVYRAIHSVTDRIPARTRVVYMTPQAEVLTQTKVEELAREENLVLLCGHYEGIDERVLEECVTDYVSIGDYVLTGGELGAAVLIDSVSRFVPGVLSNDESSQFESLQDNLLEYPQFTRPEVWHDKQVPKVLLSGDHKKVEEWRYQQSLIRTEERRPDLLRNSFKTISVSFGPEEIADTADRLSDAISRYGNSMDYNRNKLIKSRHEMGENDLLLLVMPENAEEDMAFESRFRNLYGKDSPAVIIQVTAKEKKAVNQIEEADLLLNDGENWNMSPIKAEMFLTKRRFKVLTSLSVDVDCSDEEITGIALSIRQKTLHFR